ncbi:MAG: hypothetical protein M3Z24_13785 [Chloroflexota bacterium]|nr:hypothetical protein [Chloroflexota bacterium]
MNVLSSRRKLVLTGILFVLVVGITIAAAVATVQTFHNLQQQNALATAGDVHTIGPWMTIPYISHVYHVPESYLYRSLHLTDAHPPRHMTLHGLALRSQRPVTDLIHTIQAAILTYRQQHSQMYERTHFSVIPSIYGSQLPYGRRQ